MQAFDLAEVRAFTSQLNVRMDHCDEGMECANLDDTLRNYASLCCEFCEGVREWGRAIFYSRAAFDPEVDVLWYKKGILLFRRASNLWARGQEREGDCFVLEGGAPLGSALWQLERLLASWTSPKPSAAPFARHHGTAALTPAAKEAMQNRVNELPPLPADWQPLDPGRRSLFGKIRRLRKRTQS